MSPQRIQLRRTKGWVKPEGAVVVARPSKWGNHWRVVPVKDNHFPFGDAADVTHASEDATLGRFERVGRSPNTGAAYWAVQGYRRDLTDELAALARSELKGKDLGCWCPLSQPCHGDVLLEIANAVGPPTVPTG